jgi:uncharacterized protein
VTWFVAALAIFLSLFNNVANALPLPRWTYVPLNVGVATVLVAIARMLGLSWDELGLHRASVLPGLRTGGLIVLVIVLGLALSFVLPVADRFLSDRRVAGLGTGELVYTALLRIPLGTALLEELAFRGVLYGSWRRIAPMTAAAIGSSVIFGLWHIVPTFDLLRANRIGARASTTFLLIAAGVGGTTVAGLLLVALRESTGGVLAPLIVHAAANSLATVAAVTWQRT